MNAYSKAKKVFYLAPQPTSHLRFLHVLSLPFSIIRQACWALANLSGVDVRARSTSLASSDLIDAVAALLSAEPSQLSMRNAAQSPPAAGAETAEASAPPMAPQVAAEPSAEAVPSATTAAVATATTSGSELQRLVAWLASNLCRGTVEASGSSDSSDGTPPHARTQRLLPGLLLVLTRHASALEEERGSNREGDGDGDGHRHSNRRVLPETPLASTAAATEACWAVNFFLAESDGDDAAPESTDGGGSSSEGGSREGEGEEAPGSASARAGLVLASGLADRLIRILDLDAHSGWTHSSTDRSAGDAVTSTATAVGAANTATGDNDNDNNRAGLRAAALRALASLALAASETQAEELVGLGALKAASSLLTAALESRESRRAARDGNTTAVSLPEQEGPAISSSGGGVGDDEDDDEDDEMAAAVRASLGLPVEQPPPSSTVVAAAPEAARASHGEGASIVAGAAAGEGEGNLQAERDASSSSTGSIGEEEVAKETAWLVSNLATVGAPLAQAVCDTPGLLTNLIAVVSSFLVRSDGAEGATAAAVGAEPTASSSSSSSGGDSGLSRSGSRSGAALEALWALCNVAMHSDPSQLVALMLAGAAECFVDAIHGATPSLLDSGLAGTAIAPAGSAGTAVAAALATASTTAEATASEAAAARRRGEDDDSASSSLASASTFTLGVTGMRWLITHAATMTPRSSTADSSSSSSSASDATTISRDNDPLVLLRNHPSALEAAEGVSIAFGDDDDEGDEDDGGDSGTARGADEGAPSDPAANSGAAAVPESTRLGRALKGAADSASALLDAYAVALSQRPDIEDGEEDDYEDDDAGNSESEDDPKASSEAASSEATGTAAEAATVAASATRVEAASASTTEATFFVSVPNAAELPSEIFLEMTEELVTNALGAPGLPDHAEGFTWPERGWSQKQGFLAEFRAGIHHGSSSSAAAAAEDASGNSLPRGVVARGLSREEADGLVAKLGANGLPADVHVSSSAQTVPPGVLPPPQLFTVSHGDPLPPRPVRPASMGGDDDRPGGSERGIARDAARAYMRRRGLEGFAHPFGRSHEDEGVEDGNGEPELGDPDLELPFPSSSSSSAGSGLTGRDAWVALPRPPTSRSSRGAALEAALAAQHAAMLGDHEDSGTSSRSAGGELSSRRARTAAASLLRQAQYGDSSSSPSAAAARSAAAMGGYASISEYAAARAAMASSSSSSGPSSSVGESKGDAESGEVYTFAPGECGFDLAQGRAAKFRFTNGNRTAHAPMGPILLLSSAPQPPASAAPPPATAAAAASAGAATAASKKEDKSNSSSSSSSVSSPPPVVSAVAVHTMRWRVRVSGNSSWSLGVVSATPPPHAADPASPAGRYSGAASPPSPSLGRSGGDYGDSSSGGGGGRTSPRSDALRRGGSSDPDSMTAAEMDSTSADAVSSSSSVLAWRRYPDYLAHRGRVGITSTSDKLQKLPGLEGKTIDVLVDLRRRVSVASLPFLFCFFVSAMSQPVATSFDH